MDKFEQNEMKKIGPIKITWKGWLINYILEPIRKSVVGFKDKVISIFKTNTPKQTVERNRRKKLSKPKTQNKIRNPFILKNINKIKDRIIRDILTLYETEKGKKKKERREKKEINNRLIKDRIIRDIGTRFEQGEIYYKPKRVINFWNNNYIEYESNGDKNRNASPGEIKPYLRNIITALQNSDTWKIQLTVVINFISSKDVEEERVIHSRRDNIKSTCYNDINRIVYELFESLHSRYQGNLET